MRTFFRIALLLWLVSLSPSGISEAQQALTKRDSRGPVTVAVTLTESPSFEAPLRAKVALDTHSVALDGIEFEEAVALRASDGSEIAPTAVEQASGSGHHREAVVVFTAPTKAGTLDIIVKNVGGVAERSFTWELPPVR